MDTQIHRGHPFYPPEQLKEHISFRCPPELKRRLEHYCGKYGKKRTDAIVEAIQLLLDEMLEFG